MTDKDLKELAERPATFILFVLGDPQRYLVIPARDLLAQLPNHLEGLTKEGFYHFKVVRGKRTFRELAAWDLFPYLDNIGLLSSVAKEGITCM